MSLDEYRRKRDFRRTTEPSAEDGPDVDPGGRPAGGKRRSFVVQKHAATRLHYDLRLEHDGVLLSWAVPKGPSLDPGRRRLAVRVEDHPLEYRDFEGVIPEEEYGGGAVLLWDRGGWRPSGDPDEGLRRGKLSFTLEGRKLAGRWSLVRMRGDDPGDGDEWLLIKADDDAARRGGEPDPLDERPESVATGRDLEEIARARDRVWSSADRPPPPDPASLPGARRDALPERPRPQLAARVESPPDGEDWIHEIKYDGYRILAVVDRGETVLLTRNGNDWTDRFPDVAAALGDLDVDRAVLDGEVVVLRPDGTTSFQALQRALEDGDQGAGRVTFFGFDLLHLDGHRLTDVPLADRKDALRTLFLAAGLPASGEGGRSPDDASPIRYSDHVKGRGAAFFRQACRFALEGVISKRSSAPYRPGRSREWRKSKCMERQEFVVTGFTEPSGARSGFGSLLLGYHETDGSLRFAGRVGTGFTERTLGQLTSVLERLERADPPFAPGTAVDGGRDVHWVEPRLVVEVEFAEWTRDGVLRHPSFKGIREDVEPEEVGRERPTAAASGRPEAEPVTAEGDRGTGRVAASGGGSARRRSGGGRRAPVEIEGVRLTHPDRVLYPDQGVTKRRLAEYYLSLADRVLEHVSDRPLTLLRCPGGRAGECFYQKHLNESVPDAVGTVEIQESRGYGTYLTVDAPAGLVALVQMGTLELHPWGARIDRLERPDRLVFDLDPGPGVSWVRVVDAARELRTRLADLGLRSFLKTTGGKGLHVVVPLVRRHGWADAKAFARAVADVMAEDAPDRYVAKASKAARRGRIYVDYLRNSRGATAVAPYSSRARPGAPVAVPLRWDELGPGTDPGRYTVDTVLRRIRALDEDPWRELPTVRQSITRDARETLGLGSG